MDTRARNEERKRAIEAKRKRLEEIRRNKSAGTSSASAEAARKQEKSPATPVPVPKEDAGLDKLVEELLNKPEQESSTTNDPADAGPQDAEIGVPPVRERVKLKRQVELGMVNLARREVEVYHKEIQTEITLEELQDLERQAVESQTQVKTSAAAGTGTESEEVGSGTSTDLPDDKDLTSEGPDDDANGNGNNELTDLDDEEREDIENDELFTTFLKQGVRVIERAIKQNKTLDVTVDYGGLDESKNAKQKEGLARVQTISDERWTTDRTVTEIQWSPHHKELFLTAHTKKQSSSELDWSRGGMDPGGVVCVWSMPMASERPEYVLTAQSPVHTAKFHPFASNLIIGGTYSGQIVIWDMRAKSLPVQHSLLSLESHTHPVYSMSIVGTEHAHSLVSISTDGKLCLWSLVNISHPTDTRMLKWKDSSSKSLKREVTATALAFPEGETNEFCIGTEDGSLFKAQVHGKNAGILSRIEAHFGPVTQLNFNRKMNATSDLMLSCSMDWTVKLWSQRLSKFPLATFETSNDYMFGAQWSPVHPAVFVTISGSGAINVWNLNIDSEVPQATIDVGGGSCALSSMQWEPSGKRIMVGDTRGTVQIFELSSEFYSPRGDEAARLETTVATLLETAEDNAPLSPYV